MVETGMDCCSKYPDYRHHTSMLSGRVPEGASVNNGCGISGAFYSHMHPSMRYQHSIYRLSPPGRYNGIGPSPTSSSSSNSSSSSSSQSPSSSSPYHTNYDRYSNYTNLPYGYSSNGNFSYGHLSSRADINSYYGHYDNYNQLAVSFPYHNYPLDGGLYGSRNSSPIYSSLYGLPGPGPGPERQHHHRASNGSYHPHLSNNTLPFYNNNNHHQHHSHQLHPPSALFNATKDSYVSPMSDIGSGSGSESGTCGNENDESTFSATEITSTPSPIASNCSSSNGNTTSNGIMHSNYALSSGMPACFPNSVIANSHNHMQSGLPQGTQHSTGFPYNGVNEVKSRKSKDKDKLVNRFAMNRRLECSIILNSSSTVTIPPERAETPFLPGHINGYSTSTRHPLNQSTSCCPPYSNSSQSWTQYSPKSVQKPMYSPGPQSPVSSLHYINKSRVLECDFIPSKKSRKKIITEVGNDSPEIREEIKNITPLPGFQQAFGSTEIGRFSETFFNTPEGPLDHPYESEAETMSPQPWETGDSLEGPHFNLHIGATVVQPVSYSENHNSKDSPIESSYFSEIRCSDY